MNFEKKMLLLLALCFVAFNTDLMAATTGLPWETPLQTIKKSITGPVAFTVSIVAIIAAGAGLIFGGEIQGFLKVVIFIVLVIALIVAAQNILDTLYGSNSAVLPSVVTNNKG